MPLDDVYYLKMNKVQFFRSSRSQYANILSILRDVPAEAREELDEYNSFNLFADPGTISSYKCCLDSLYDKY